MQDIQGLTSFLQENRQKFYDLSLYLLESERNDKINQIKEENKSIFFKRDNEKILRLEKDIKTEEKMIVGIKCCKDKRIDKHKMLNFIHEHSNNGILSTDKEKKGSYKFKNTIYMLLELYNLSFYRIMFLNVFDNHISIEYIDENNCIQHTGFVCQDIQSNSEKDLIEVLIYKDRTSCIKFNGVA